MHLIVIIALGIFGGLWLFTRWAEWREARLLRKYLYPKPPKPARSFDDSVRAFTPAILCAALVLMWAVSWATVAAGGR
jgi:hypothetical protein